MVRLLDHDVLDAATTASQDLVHSGAGVGVGWAASEVRLSPAFSDGLPPNRACRFRSTRLSSTSF
jgi:hypothetical protein